MRIRMLRVLTLILAVLFASGAVACTPVDGGTVTAPSKTEETVTSAPTDAPADTAKTDETAENTAPDFAVLDADGRVVKLSDFFGTPIVLNFWASWCPPCKAELPDFEAACKAYEGRVVFLMVNMTDGQRETVAVAKEYLASEGYTFPVYFDTGYEAAYAYGVSSIPQTYFIAADGSVQARATGMISAAQLEQGIGMICSE